MEKLKETKKDRIKNVIKDNQSKLTNAKKVVRSSYQEKNKELTKELANERSIVSEEEKQNYNFNKERIKRNTNDSIKDVKKS